MNLRWKDLLMAAACLTFGLAFAKPPGNAGRAAEVERTERSRFQAMVVRDYSALDRVLSEDMTYGLSDGRTRSKTEFMAALKAGTLSYKSISPAELKVRLYGDAAVVNGVADMVVVPKGGEMAVRVRFTDVYVSRGAGWVMVAWQSAQIPPG